MAEALEALEATKLYHKQKINTMTLSETILKKHQELLYLISEREELEIGKDDLNQMLNDSENLSYHTCLQIDHKLGIIKLLIESAKAYGEAKWNEAIEAAREAQCSDKNTPPKFIP